MIQREVTRAGGRVHDIVHTDRSYQLQQPTKFGSQRTVAIEKCTCGLAKVLVDVPYTKANGFASTEGARLCIVCDALDQTPRFHQ